MDNNTQATIIATIVSTMISSIVAVLITKSGEKASKKNSILDKIIELNNLGLEYPYLESDSFCDDFDSYKTKSDERYMRYDVYCCQVFNLLEEAFTFCNYKEKQLGALLGYEEMITTHKKWWLDIAVRSKNIYGYNIRFINFVDNSLGIKNIL